LTYLLVCPIITSSTTQRDNEMESAQYNKVWDFGFDEFCKKPQQKRDFLPVMQNKFPSIDVDELKSIINEIIDEYSSACSYE